MPKILVVDDEPNIVRLVQVNLVRAGYEVISARDGREALEKVASDKPDLLILDVDMPVMGGYAVVEKLMADPSTASIPVVMFSIHSVTRRDNEQTDVLPQGVAAYLTKPINPLQILATIKNILGRQESIS